MTLERYIKVCFIAGAAGVLAMKGFTEGTVVAILFTGIFLFIMYWLKVAGENNPPSDSKMFSIISYYLRKTILASLAISTLFLCAYLLKVLVTKPSILIIASFSLSVKLFVYFYLTAFTKVRIFKSSQQPNNSFQG